MRGLVEIRVTSSGWEATMFAAGGYHVETLPGSAYELTLRTGEVHLVRGRGTNRVTGEVRLVGIGAPPAAF
jgi:hypothetical protein